MLHMVATATVEMAGATGLPAGPAHIPGHLQEIDTLRRHAGPRRLLAVGAGSVMADQAVDIRRVTEVIRGISPPIARMAACTAGPIGRHGDTENIDPLLLAQFNLFLAARNLRHRVEFACIITRTARGAFIQIDLMNSFLFALNGVNGAILLT